MTLKARPSGSTAAVGKDIDMTQTICPRGFHASVTPTPEFPSATPAEREARRLLYLNTPEETARAEQVLSESWGEKMSAEWYFLMGICALRRRHIADAQATWTALARCVPPRRNTLLPMTRLRWLPVGAARTVERPKGGSTADSATAVSVWIAAKLFAVKTAVTAAGTVVAAGTAVTAATAVTNLKYI